LSVNGRSNGFVRFDVVAIANDDGRTDEQEETGCDKDLGAATCAVPLFEGQSPERREDDDRCHVKRPTGEIVFAHPGLSHGVKKELEVPDDAG